MFLFIENYSFGEEHIIAEKVKVSTEELTALSEVAFHRKHDVLYAVNWFGPCDNQSNNIYGASSAPGHTEEDCPFTAFIIETCNIFSKNTNLQKASSHHVFSIIFPHSRRRICHSDTGWSRSWDLFSSIAGAESPWWWQACGAAGPQPLPMASAMAPVFHFLFSKREARQMS